MNGIRDSADFDADKMTVTATLVITTKNRKEELRNALASALRQSEPLEIIVIDDGSTDGTSEMVCREFPSVRLERSEISLGLIAQRNRGAALAEGDVIFSIDDDAEFSNSDVVMHTLADFAGHEEIGAVAIPYIEPHKQNMVQQKAPDEEGVWAVSTYIGTAHAVRRELFLKLGGYRELLVHQGEENDFCIRLMDDGYYVRLGNAPMILHHESPKRDFSRMDYYGARNAVLFAWQNVPWPYLPIHLIVTTGKCLMWSWEPARLRIRARALWEAWKMIPTLERKAVRAETYRRFRELRQAWRMGYREGLVVWPLL